MSQLRMFLDIEKHPLPDYPVPEGFRITRNGPEVAERYEVLREGAGWGKLKPDFLTNKIIPKGLVFCEDIATGLPVASATAEFSDYPGHRGDWGNLGQVLSLESYRGRKLGLVSCLTAMRIIAETGFTKATLLTDDWRVPAIRIYLGTGWRPWLSEPDMPERWQKICEGIGVDYNSLETYDNSLLG